MLPVPLPPRLSSGQSQPSPGLERSLPVSCFRLTTLLRRGLSLLLPVVLVVSLSLTGCQVDVGGQTLPSAYYLQDDIQYFPAGPEFKLSKEAAALKAYKKELGDCPDGCGGSGCSSCK